jgi:pimeloyl-ACP methyl ester carboxylesterase
MFDLVDFLLLKRATPLDDEVLTLRRIDGHATSKVIYFLPWHTPFGWARRVGLVPLDFLACYEMPRSIVSPHPTRCVQAMLALAGDAERLLREHGVRAKDALIVGLSAGTFPATFLANRIGARLCSVASIDRADLAVWLSPATRIVKLRAMQLGFELSDYAKALHGFHPSQNLAGLGSDSVFVIGERDPFIPQCCKEGLLQAIDKHARKPLVIKVDLGHFGTLRASSRLQRTMVATEQSRSRWQIRLPLRSFPCPVTPTQRVPAVSACRASGALVPPASLPLTRQTSNGQ